MILSANKEIKLITIGCLQGCSKYNFKIAQRHSTVNGNYLPALNSTKTSSVSSAINVFLFWSWYWNFSLYMSVCVVCSVLHIWTILKQFLYFVLIHFLKLLFVAVFLEHFWLHAEHCRPASRSDREKWRSFIFSKHIHFVVQWPNKYASETHFVFIRAHLFAPSPNRMNYYYITNALADSRTVNK